MVLFHTPAFYAEPRATARFSFKIRIAASPTDAILPFSPEGERGWSPDWDPIYANALAPRDVGAGTVFTTNDHALTRVWIVDEYNRKSGRIRYTVFAPGKSVTRIAIAARAVTNGSEVTVSYDRTALTAAQDADVKAFAGHAERMREEWQNAITAALQRR